MDNFFTQFYTHKYQIYDNSNIQSWVLLDNNSYQTRPNQRNENQINLRCYVDNQTDKLTIDVNNGYIYVDCSQPITADKPIPCSDSSLQGKFNFYDFNLITPQSTTDTKYALLESNINKIYPYYNSQSDANYQNLKIESINNISSINISNIPYGNKIIKRYKDDVLISYVTDNTINDGCLPNEFLNNDINETIYNAVNLYSWSIALLSLIEQKEDLLIYKSLVYIINTFKKNYAATSINGLPSLIKENYSEYSLERIVLNNAWAGYSILQAIGYLSNRPTSKIISLPIDIKLVVDSITSLILECFNVDSLVFGYDSYGGRIDTFDVCGTYITDIFLNQYLCYFYDFNIYSKHNLLHKFCIDFIYTNYRDIAYLNTNIIQVNIYKSFWIFYFDRNVEELLNIHNEIKSEISNVNINDYDVNLLSLLNIKLFDLELIPDTIPLAEIGNLYINYKGLYVRTTKYNLAKFLYLIDCSWGQLLHSNTELFNPVNYKLETDLINFECLDLLKSLIDSWPTGTKWTSFTSTYDKTTVIGSIFSSIAFITTDWNLLRHHLIDSTACNTSQGDSLDKWGNILNYYRPLYQADYYYKDSLLLLLNKSNPTVANLQNFVRQFLDDSNAIVITQKLPNIYFLNSNNVWVNRPWICNKADVDLINSQLDSNSNPCFYLPNLLGVMVLVPLYKFIGQIDINSSNLNLSNSIIISNTVSAGVVVNLKKTDTYTAVSDFNTSEFSINTI